MLRNFFTFSRFTLFVALCISAIAAWYSVIGLTAIFAGAVIPIIIMGSILEIAKITTTVWLHKYWDRASWSIKSYLTTAVIVLAFLTSMGIFGLLSKAHLEQNVVGGEVQAKLSLIDEKIKTQRDNIDVARRALQQMDAQVDARLSRGDSEQSAERAVQIRRQQAAERGKLQREIGEAQKEIAKLNEERAPIASQVRKVEAEVGPVKYIAAVIYGDNPDVTTLEKAVRWVTILIVLVFDPLAIILILAANNSLKWERQDKSSKPAEAIIPANAVAPVAEPAPVTEWPSEWKEFKSDDEVSTDEVLADVQKQEDSDTIDYSKHAYLNRPWVDHAPGEERVKPIVVNRQDEDSQINALPIGESTTDPDYRQDKYESSYTILEPDIDVTKKLEQLKAVSVTKAPVEEKAPRAETVIVTDGVTKEVKLYSADDDYAVFNDKKISIDALKQLKPELVINGPVTSEIMFGTMFPALAKIGDIYTRVDVIPHRTYKFNGARWIQIDRATNTTYLQNVAYIQYLVAKLESGEYDPDMLSGDEQDEISAYLKKSI